ncbi:uncharacterized protein N7483_008552 [Penicillium malachiteum]|uniref:uncharacterized protein n=1 Tax=Penicillium malachiteum TaxID=1324776 RepID=UPI0025495D0E|nr:uncharacterized protein N7483_008552 [Penicillium malachiteum]KAJ5720618.1 hypothetical protein N7483_008552 [Penicillium malachiteum]
MVSLIKMYAILIAFLFSLYLYAAFPAVEAAIAGIDDAIMTTITPAITSTNAVLALSPGRRSEVYYDPPLPLSNSTDSKDDDGDHDTMPEWSIWTTGCMVTIFILGIIWWVASKRWPAIRPDFNWRTIIAGLRNALHKRRRPEPAVELDWLGGGSTNSSSPGLHRQREMSEEI